MPRESSVKGEKANEDDIQQASNLYDTFASKSFALLWRMICQATISLKAGCDMAVLCLYNSGRECMLENVTGAGDQVVSTMSGGVGNEQWHKMHANATCQRKV